MMRGKSAFIGIGALVLSAAAPALWAGPPAARTEAHIVTRSSRPADDGVKHVNLGPSGRDKVTVVHRPVVNHDATVSRSLHEQPVAPHLVHLVVVNTPITIDPHQRLGRETGGIDQQHYLYRAQRAWLNRHAKPAHIIHGSPKRAQQEQATQPTPAAIMRVPRNIRDRQDNERGPKAIPSVPAPPKEKNAPSMVRAE